MYVYMYIYIYRIIGGVDRVHLPAPHRGPPPHLSIYLYIHICMYK